MALDGLRGVAAVSVALMHLQQTARFKAAVPMPSALAVDFFFMLSGFVLAYAYFDRLDRGMPWCTFMRARVIRLYPLIPIGVLLGAGISLLKQHVQAAAVPGEAWFDIPIALLLLPAGLIAPRPTPNFTFNPPALVAVFRVPC